jgi:hypothetical protein
MASRARIGHALAVASLFAAATCAAVPVGYRYVGSRVVSAGHVVYWYWSVDHIDISVNGAAFVARMYARAVEINQERPYIAEIRCDSRTYREFGGQGQWVPVEPGEPIAAVLRAGCDGARAVTLAERNARLAGGVAPPVATAGASERVATGPAPAGAAPAAVPTPAPRAESAKLAQAQTSPAAAKENSADPRRVDQCVRFAEAKGLAAGDATITNACTFPVEVSLCYKGGRAGLYDCPAPPRGKRSDSLGPGVTHVLPEYRRAAHKGVALVACKGAMGSVFPRLDDASGRTGCF